MDIDQNTIITIEIEEIYEWISKKLGSIIAKENIISYKTVRTIGVEKPERIIITIDKKI